MTPINDKPPVLRFLWLFACLVAGALWLATLSESASTSAAAGAATAAAPATPDPRAFVQK